MTDVGEPTSVHPLSPMQQGMLFQILSTQAPGVYVAQVTCRLGADLDVPAFERAWQTVLDRHEALRVAFDWSDGAEPVQRVHPRIACRIVHQDWRALDVRARRARLDAERRIGFDLCRPPLMRFTLGRTSDREQLFVWTHHQLLLDGRSRVIVLKEVASLYEASQRGHEIELPPPLPIADSVAWTRQQTDRDAGEYWRALLGTFTSPVVLAADTPDGVAGDHHTRPVKLRPGVTAALHELARRHHVTVNIVVQAAWAVLLSRYADQRDVVFGATRACRRSFDDGGRAIGVLMNTLPHRLTIEPARPFAALLGELRAQHRAMRDHQLTPLVDVRRSSGVSGHTALFDSIVVFDERDLHQALHAEDAALWRRGIHRSVHTHYAVTLSGYTKPALRLEIDARDHAFDGAALDRLVGHFAVLLEAIAAAPCACTDELPLVGDVERRALIDASDGVRRPVPSMTLSQLFEAQAAKTPDRVALVDAERCLTYRALDERANRLAHVLLACLPAREPVVAVAAPRSLDMVVALLAVWKAGAVYLPLDPEYPAGRLASMMADARPVYVLRTSGVRIPVPSGVRSFVLDDPAFERTLAATPTTTPNPGRALSSARAAYVIYTSGSTGTPKGVVVSHRSIVNKISTLVEYLELSPATRFAATSSISFDPLFDQLFCPLSCGGATVVVSDRVRDDAATLREHAERHGVTAINATPALVERLCADGELRVDLLMVGADVFPGALAARLRQSGAARRILNLYGPTETCINASAFDASGDTGDSSVPIGSALPNYRLVVMDHAGHLQPVGRAGELYIGGAGVARGYLNRARLTAERFVPDPTGEYGARLYRTGDIVTRRTDGQLTFHGRRDDQVKIRGFRIEPAEIAHAIEQHPTIARAVVIATADERGEKRLVAYVVTHGGAGMAADALRAFLVDKLPASMVPALVVSLDAFPLTPTGKIDRAALPAPPLTSSRQSVSATPRTPLEAALASIWSDVLGVPSVGISDNFFDLGGHSLSAMQLVARVRERLDVELTVSAVLVDQTIERLATTIERATASEGAERVASRA